MKKTDVKTTIGELRREVAKFIRERDWEQFHSGKNLSMSLAIEAAELMEHFQWSAPDAPCSEETLAEIRRELADVVIYALDFCNMMDIDLATAIREKLEHNRRKYPADKVRGKSHKYTYYQKKGRSGAARKKAR